jgi:hypothetical protein
MPDESCVNAKFEEALSDMVEFLAQSLTGVYMGLFRCAGISPSVRDAQTINFRKASLAQYYNGIWKSLILKDDEYVVTTFTKIHSVLVDESPLCLIHKFFAIGCFIFENVPINCSTMDHTNPASLPPLRALLNEILKSYSRQALTPLIKADHKCDGPKFSTLSQTEDPNGPIFTLSS